MPAAPKPIQSLQEVKFYLHHIKFIPFASSQKKTNDILFDTLNFLNKEFVAGKAYAIDRNKGKPEMERREMFMNNPVRVPRTKKFKCSIALLKDKSLMVKPKDTFELVPFDTATGLIATVTHFYIDYSVSPAIICAQFNNDGPRISDIEFYFRSLSMELRYSKGCQTTTCLYAPIDITLEHLQNVLNFEIKLRPQSIAQMDNDIKNGFISDFAVMAQRLKPTFMRVEAMFQTPGSNVKSKLLNKEATSFIKSLLKKCQDQPQHIDQIEEFEIKFVNQDGEDEVFNLIKGKREIVVKINRDEHMTTSKYYNLIEADFEAFIQTFNL
ncbi:hypothetical protein FHW88_005156 [Mucilaginibacter sp. SG538B]|uniref:hypothetical protein n=1 Tax=Mucilaginibacter sp. SG538B TaxID=2587021 RepID=UPI00159E9D3A|nr:hypothetical protein [Mucilaginibacter sp. SG538B]NVM66838.1 hypothetical protein [Mucilaginibacter sp. SG538B]